MSTAETQMDTDYAPTEMEQAPAIIDADPPRPITKRDMEQRGVDVIDRNRAGQVKISVDAGGISFSSALEVMEFAKMMAVSGTAVPAHCRSNPGLCLAITFQAVEWRMSPFAVASLSYVVNDRLAYQSMLIHAVIEARAPLRERLQCSYEGDGTERACTIKGLFRDGTDREYTSPIIGKIKVKNSPLWIGDPDQQLFYFASRSWARKWCPDVLLGVYTKEEMQQIEPPKSESQNLRERLQSADRGEGHQPGGAVDELSRVANEANSTIKPADDKTTADPDKTKGKAARAPGKGHAASPSPAANKAKKKSDPPRATTLSNPKNAATKSEASAAADRAQARSDAKRQQQQETDTPKSVPTKPKSSAEYQVYCIDWIGRASDPEAALGRWEQERNMRDDCTVPVKMRNDLRERLEKKHGV